MMTDTLIVLIKCFSAVLLAVLAGNGGKKTVLQGESVIT